MPMIGARFYTHLDSAMLRADVIENELAKVRFSRNGLISKLITSSTFTVSIEPYFLDVSPFPQLKTPGSNKIDS